jgi:hypothetical protein
VESADDRRRRREGGEEREEWIERGVDVDDVERPEDRAEAEERRAEGEARERAVAREVEGVTEAERGRGRRTRTRTKIGTRKGPGEEVDAMSARPEGFAFVVNVLADSAGPRASVLGDDRDPHAQTRYR